MAASIRKIQQDDFVPEVDEWICGLTGVSYGGFADSVFLRDTSTGETGADLEHILIWLRDTSHPKIILSTNYIHSAVNRNNQQSSRDRSALIDA